MESNKNAFTLMEITIAVVIVGILAALALPSFNLSIEQTRAQAAKNNLLAIAAGQQKYFEDHANTYCLAGCADSTAEINQNLVLDMGGNDPFNDPALNSYSCASAQQGDPPGTQYRCIASDGTDALTLTYSTTTGNSVVCQNANNNTYCPNFSAS